MYACGPPYGGSSPFDSIGYQCVELSARFLWAVYGKYVSNVPDGRDFVAGDDESWEHRLGTRGPVAFRQSEIS